MASLISMCPICKIPSTSRIHDQTHVIEKKKLNRMIGSINVEKIDRQIYPCKCPVCKKELESAEEYVRHFTSFHKLISKAGEEPCYDWPVFCFVCKLYLKPHMVQRHIQGFPHSVLIDLKHKLIVEGFLKPVFWTIRLEKILCKICNVNLESCSQSNKHFESKSHKTKYLAWKDCHIIEDNWSEHNFVYCVPCDKLLDGTTLDDEHYSQIDHIICVYSRYIKEEKIGIEEIALLEEKLHRWKLDVTPGILKFIRFINELADILSGNRTQNKKDVKIENNLQTGGICKAKHRIQSRNIRISESKATRITETIEELQNVNRKNQSITLQNDTIRSDLINYLKRNNLFSKAEFIINRLIDENSTESISGNVETGTAHSETGNHQNCTSDENLQDEAEMIPENTPFLKDISRCSNVNNLRTDPLNSTDEDNHENNYLSDESLNDLLTLLEAEKKRREMNGKFLKNQS